MAESLWEPTEEQIEKANMTRFMKFVNQKHGKDFKTYDELYKWSIADIPDLWEAIWEFGEVVHSAPPQTIVDDLDRMPGSKWFGGARMNFAENLLRFRVCRMGSFGTA